MVELISLLDLHLKSLFLENKKIKYFLVKFLNKFEGLRHTVFKPQQVKINKYVVSLQSQGKQSLFRLKLGSPHFSLQDFTFFVCQLSDRRSAIVFHKKIIKNKKKYKFRNFPVFFRCKLSILCSNFYFLHSLEFFSIFGALGTVAVHVNFFTREIG